MFQMSENGTHVFSVDEGLSAELNVFYVAAYDQNNNIVTANGTIAIAVSPISQQFHSIPSQGDGVIDLQLAGHRATYMPPVFLGTVNIVEFTVTGFSNAAYIYVTMMRK